MIQLHLLISFFLLTPNSGLEPGIYKSDNDLFIELKINEARDSITFFFPEKSGSGTDTKWTTIAINPNFRKGKIEVDANKIRFLSMERDFYGEDLPKDMRIKNGSIYVDCSNLTEYMFRRANLGNCHDKYIIFEKK